jgi:hypothetical protein
MGMLQHRPHASNVAVVSLLQKKNSGETLILKKKKNCNRGFILKSKTRRTGWRKLVVQRTNPTCLG